MINTEILSEKFKYLITTETGKEFDIITISLDVEWDSDMTSIYSYTVDVRFDYNSSIDFELEYFIRDIRTMSNKMRDIVSKYGITSKGKIVLGGNKVQINNGRIWGIDFNWDEKHIFNMSFNVRAITEK